MDYLKTTKANPDGTFTKTSDFEAFNDVAPTEAIPVVIEMQREEPRAPQGEIEIDLPDKRSPLETMYHDSKKITPEVAAYAKTFGEIPAFVDKHLDSLKEVEKTPDSTFFQELEAEYPGTTKWLSTPENMAAAREHLPELKKAEANFRGGALAHTMNFSRAMWKQIYPQASDAFDSGVYNVMSGIAKTPALAYDTAALAAKPSGSYHPFGFDTTLPPTPEWLYKNSIIDTLDARAKAKVPAEMQRSISDLIGQKQWKAAAETALLHGVANIPQMAMIIAASAGGAGKLGAAGLGLLTSAQSNVDDRKSGVPQTTVTAGALAKGAIETGSEALGTVLPFEHFGKELIKKFGTKNAFEVIKAAAASLAGQFLSEGTEEFASSYAQDIVDKVSGVNPEGFSWEGSTFTDPKMVKKGIDAFFAGGVSGIGMGSVNVAMASSARLAEIKQVENTKKILQAIQETENDELRKSLPKIHQDFIEHVTKDGPVANVHIPVDKFQEFFQSKELDPGQMADSLGVKDSYEEAARTGGTVSIPLATVTSQLVGTEYFQGLRPDMKFHEDDLTQREHEELQAEEQANMEALGKEIEQGEVPKDQVARIAHDVYTQAVEAGMSKAEAKAGATLMALRWKRAAEAYSKKSGEEVDPWEMYQLNRLKIDRGQPKPTEETPPGEIPDDIEYFQENDKFNQKNNVIDASHLFPKGDRRKGPRRDEEKAPPVENMFEKFKARFGDDKGAESAINNAQSPKHGPYVTDPNVPGIGWVPNFLAEPTGVIGPDRISQPHELNDKKEIDPLLWADSKYGVTKMLIEKHRDQNIPLVINTSSDLIASADYIEAMPKGTVVNMYLLPEDSELPPRGGLIFSMNRQLFPGNPSRERQLEAMKVLREKGITVNAVESTVEQVIAAAGGKRKAAKALGVKMSEVEAYIAERMSPQKVKPLGKAFRPTEPIPSGTKVNLPDGQRGFIDGDYSHANSEGERIYNVKTDGASWKETQQLSESEIYNANKDLQQASESSGETVLQSVPGEKQNEVEASEPPVDLTPSIKPPAQKFDWGLAAELSKLTDPNTQNERRTWFKSTEDAVDAADNSSDPRVWMKAVLYLEDQEARGWKHRDQDFIKHFTEKLRPLIAKTKMVRYGTPSGNLWLSRSDAPGEKSRFAVGVERNQTREQAVAGAQQIETMSPRQLMASGKPAQLVVGTSNYIRQQLPFGVLQRYDLFLLLHPQAGNELEFGVAYVSRTDKGDSGYVSVRGTDAKATINQAIHSVLIAVTPDDTFSTGDTEASETRPESDKKMDVWFSNWLYRQPKVSLRDALSFEPAGLEQGSDNGPRGRIRFTMEGSSRVFNISLLENADKSTFFHELGHYFLEVMGDMALAEDAPEEIAQDYKQLLSWFGVSSREEVKTEHHEKFARAFEAYLREGKAPVKELQPAFTRLRNWLMKVYQSITQLDIQLTPEVRGIMDRMFAAQEEIDAAQREAGMTSEQKENDRVAAFRQKVRAKAVDELMKIQMKELELNHQEFLKSERERLTKEAEENVEQSTPVFAAQNTLEREAYVKRPNFVKEAHAFIEGRMRPDYVAYWEVAAEEHGFASGEDLATQIVSADVNGLKPQLVEARVEQGMQAHANLMDTDAIRDKALELVHSEQANELIAMEWDAMMEIQAPEKMKPGRTSREEAKIKSKAAKETARKIIANKRLKQVNPRTYIANERKAALKAQKALAEKDYEAAARFKDQQILNHALAAEAMRAKKEAASHVKFIKQFVGRGQDMMDMPYGFIRQIDDLLARFGFQAPVSQDLAVFTKIAQDMALAQEDPVEIANRTGLKQGSGGFTPETLLDFIERVTENYYNIDRPDPVILGGSQPIQDLTMGQLKALRDTIQQIAKIGKSYERYLSDFQKAGLNESAKALRTSVLENVGAPYADRSRIGSKNKSALGDKIDAILALPDKVTMELVNVLTLCHFLDGGKEDGPAKQFIYRVMKHAEDRKLRRYEQMRAEFDKNVLEKFFTPKELAAYKDQRYFVPEFGRNMTREEILAIALNWGNEGNRSRIMAWENVTQQEVEKVLQVLTKKEWDFVQAVWDHLESYWPDIKKLEMDVRGVEVKQVEASVVNTKYGEYRGGYYPIAYDFTKSAEAKEHALEKNALYKQFSPAKAHTDTGHTQARVSYLARPVNLSLSVLFNHLENIVHDLEYRPAVIDVNKFLSHKDVKQSIIHAIGIEGYRAMTEWLKAVASDQGEHLGFGEKFMRGFRFKTTFAALGYRFAALLPDISGNVINSIDEIGPKRTGKAIAEYVMSPIATREFVNAKSERMRKRSLLRDRDMADIGRKWAGKAPGRLGLYAFAVQSFADESVSYPLWMTVYREAVSEHGEQKAIDMADEAVTRTMGSGSMIDQVGVQRGGEFKKLTSMFYSWASMMFNRGWLSTKQAQTQYRNGNVGTSLVIMAKATVLLWVAHGLNEALWKELLRNRQSDDEEERWKRVTKRFFGQPFSYVWLARDVGGYFVSQLTGDKQARYQLSPIESALETLIKPITKEADDQKDLEDISRAASIAFGYPQQINNLAWNFIDWLQGNGEASWKDFVNRRTKK